MKHLDRQKAHLYLYVFGIALFLCSMPLSKFMVSVAQFVLVGNWILEGNITEKFKKFFKNKTALILTSLFLLHLIGLGWTSDFNTALKDLRIKLPLLLFPVLFSSMPVIPGRWLRNLMILFTAAVFSSTFISYLVYLGVIHKKITDIRDISIYISHIRLSLLVCISFFILIYNIIYCQTRFWTKLLSIALCLWFLFFLNLIESATGFILTGIVSLFLLVVTILKTKSIWQKIAISLLLGILIFVPTLYIYLQISSFYKEKHSAKDIRLEKTASGNPYSHDIKNNSIENSTYIYRNINQLELRQEWNKRSAYKFDGFDKKGQVLYYTLLRFLASKGLNKDSAAISKLNKQDIKAVEEGVANYKYIHNNGLSTRIHQIIWEIDNYQETGNPNNHSVTLKAEFWKTSLHIIKKNLFFGVGTGDIDDSFKSAYKERKTVLDKEFRLKSHNQYLRITILFGILGLIWFLATLIYPVTIAKNRHYHYLVFFIIMLFSMISEDTLETQTGVSFFAFFNSFYIFLWNKDEE